MRKLLFSSVVTISLSGCAFFGHKSHYSIENKKIEESEDFSLAQSCVSEFQISGETIRLTPSSNFDMHLFGPLVLPIIPTSTYFGKEISNMTFRVDFPEDSKLTSEFLNKDNWSLNLDGTAYKAKTAKEVPDANVIWIDFEFPSTKPSKASVSFKTAGDPAYFQVSYEHERKSLYLPFAVMPMDAGACVP